MLKSALFAVGAMAFVAAFPVSAAMDSAPAPGAQTTSPAAAATPTTPVDPVNVEAQKRDAQIVCKTTAVTGSLLGGKKTCLTRLQWEQQAAEAQRDLNGIQLQGSSFKSPN